MNYIEDSKKQSLILSNDTSSKMYFLQLTAYSGIAIFLVVILHALNRYLNLYGVLLNVAFSPRSFDYIVPGYSKYLVKTIVNILEPLPVPMFIFIAGFKYELNYRNRDYKSFFRTRINKVFMPFLLLSILFIIKPFISDVIRHYLMNTNQKINLDITMLLKQFIKIFVGYNAAYQLWYIPMFLLVVLIYPIISKHIKSSILRLLIFVLIAVIVTLLIQNIEIFKQKPYPVGFLYFFYLYELGCIFAAKDKANQLNISFFGLVMYVILLLISVVTNNYYIYLISRGLLVPTGVFALYYISCLTQHYNMLLKFGEYSFYIFLFHEPIILTTTLTVLYKCGVKQMPLLLIISTVITIFFSILTYKIIILLYNKFKNFYHKTICTIKI